MQTRRNVRFDERFDRAERTVKFLALFAAIVTILQIAILIACAGGIVYCIYEYAHWIKW